MYGRLSTQFYDLDKPEPPPQALAFYLQRATRSPGPLLEPMCGSGRFLIPIARAGYAIDGVDDSNPMLTACRVRLDRLGLRANLYQARIQDMALPGQYGMILVPAGSLGLLVDPADLAEALARVYEHLVPGGTFLCEVPLRSQLPDVPERSWSDRVRRPDGATIHLAGHLVSYIPEEGISRSMITYQLKAGHRLREVETEEFVLRFHDPGDFASLLADAGFEDIEVVTYDGSDGDDEDDDTAPVFCAQKPL